MIGVDEAGRGAWAGPFLAVAVRLRGDWSQAGLADSKQLSARRRLELAQLLQARLDGNIGISLIEAAQIDEYGLSWAQQQAMAEAVGQLNPQKEEAIIVDGSINYLSSLYASSRAVVQADSKFPAVMAASILAKVKRDQLMVDLDKRHPNYHFARHKGYGTLLHRQALQSLGALKHIHRYSYKPLLPFTK